MSISLLHHAWRTIPKPIRSRAFGYSTSVLAPKKSLLQNVDVGQTTVAGLFSVGSGLGQGARRLFDSLKNLNIDVNSYDLGGAFRQSDMEWDGDGATGGGPLIVHINGPHIPYALLSMPKIVSSKRYVIGYWNWELPVVPQNWRIAEKHLHEIWTSSSFTAEALRELVNIPVHVVPYSFSVESCQPMSRSRFKIPDDTFLVFNSFNAGSGYSRKNPEAALRAYLNTFSGSSEAHLLIKISNADLAQEQVNQLKDMAAEHSNVTIICDKFSTDEVFELMAMVDAVISLHRSEGYGFLMAEAMHLNCPVVATKWSGNLDFMTDENSWLVPCKLADCFDSQGTYDLAGVKWADADVDWASKFLSEIYNDKEAAKVKVVRAKENITVYSSILNFQEHIPNSSMQYMRHHNHD